MAATNSKGKQIYPLVVVLVAISVIEIAMTVMYPKLTEPWERVPALVVILVVPLGIVGAFVYLWIKRPGHLYPPSEFGTGDIAEKKMVLFSCGAETARQLLKNSDAEVIDAEYIVENDHTPRRKRKAKEVESGTDSALGARAKHAEPGAAADGVGM